MIQVWPMVEYLYAKRIEWSTEQKMKSQFCLISHTATKIYILTTRIKRPNNGLLKNHYGVPFPYRQIRAQLVAEQWMRTSHAPIGESIRKLDWSTAVVDIDLRRSVQQIAHTLSYIHCVGALTKIIMIEIEKWKADREVKTCFDFRQYVDINWFS